MSGNTLGIPPQVPPKAKHILMMPKCVCTRSTNWGNLWRLSAQNKDIALDSPTWTISWETHCDHDSLRNCEVSRPTQWQWFTTVDRKRHLYNHPTPNSLWHLVASILWCSWFVQNKARLIASVWISLWQTAKCISSSHTDFIILVVKGYNNQHLKERPLSTVSGHLPRTFAQYAFKGQRLATFLVQEASARLNCSWIPYLVLFAGRCQKAIKFGSENQRKKPTHIISDYQHIINIYQHIIKTFSNRETDVSTSDCASADRPKDLKSSLAPPRAIAAKVAQVLVLIFGRGSLRGVNMSAY